MLLFSDVDGTLLDDAGRCPLPHDLVRQAAARHTIILASSRTVPELVGVQRLLGITGPMIAEDGAVLILADGSQRRLGAPQADLIERLRGTTSESLVGELVRSRPESTRDREASILVPVDLATPAFRRELGSRGLEATPGGRWATITSGADKGRAAGVLARHLGVTRWTAVGNAANDAALLASARPGFVIRNRAGHDPSLAALDGVVLLETLGPAGWVEMLTDLRERSGDVDGEARDGAAVDDHHPDDSRP